MLGTNDGVLLHTTATNLQRCHNYQFRRLPSFPPESNRNRSAAKRVQRVYQLHVDCYLCGKVHISRVSFVDACFRDAIDITVKVDSTTVYAACNKISVGGVHTKRGSAPRNSR